MNDVSHKPDSSRHHFTKVEFRRFKAFRTFSLHLRHFNILAGPNNAGKSTILTAFRILAAGIRKANRVKPELVPSPDGRAYGYVVELSAISVAEENIFYDYDESVPAVVTFTLSNTGTLKLYFPERGACYLIPSPPSSTIRTPTQFRTLFNCPIGFVPILGPVDHNERLFEKEAARLALYNYKAARNFRNIWYHYPEHFDTFRALLKQTWPGMDIQRPKVDMSHAKPVLHMFCPEDRIPREIFWAGFGFQVWCQMLTHLVQSNDVSLFLIDEPDIYLHSDLQRQLVGLLRNLGPDILIATHSAEIITEAETDDIVLVDKKRTSARRIKDPAQLSEVFAALGSNLNPILTQLAKTRRAIFVEGKDFQILAKVARKLGLTAVASRNVFGVIPIDGFNPDRIRSMKQGIEATLGGAIASAVLLDRDYRSEEECEAVTKACSAFCDVVAVHGVKEVENFLLVPAALDRAAVNRLRDRERRMGGGKIYSGDASAMLSAFAGKQKNYVIAQRLARAKQFARASHSPSDEATINERALERFEEQWKTQNQRFALVPGKEALGAINKSLQSEFGVSLTPTAIIDAMHIDEMPPELRALLVRLEDFASQAVGDWAD